MRSSLFTLLGLAVVLTILGCHRPVETRIVTVTKGNIESIVSGITSGSVKAERVADLSFGAVGRVRALSVKLGEMVEQGAVLAELENNDLIAAAETAEHEYTRQLALYRSRVIAEQDLDRARERRDTTKVALDKSRIVAPFRGVVTELNLEVGQLSQITAVEPKPLIRLVDTDARFVRVEIDEVDLAKVQPGMSAKVRILAVRKKPFAATVRKVIRAVNATREQDRTATVELTLAAHQEELPEGASADVDITVGTKDNVLVVPSRAVMGRLGSSYVFIEQRMKASKRFVEVGIRGFEQTEILQGITEGERVLIPAELSAMEDGVSIKELPPEPKR